MPRSKDPLTAAVTTYWKPLMREHAFRDYSIPSPHIIGRRKRHIAFGRSLDGAVFQFIAIKSKSDVVTGEREFELWYGSTLLTRLKYDVFSTTAGFLGPGPESPGTWNVTTHELADVAMLDAVQRARAVALPWLDATSTTGGLVRELETQRVKEYPHMFLELGCCLASTETAAAIEPLREAVRLFQGPSAERAFGGTAAREREFAEQLLAAIAEGTQDRLLADWKAQTITNLQLEKIMGARPGA